ncbi:hypothetical protein D3C77_364730 [compost metagenome]
MVRVDAEQMLNVEEKFRQAAELYVLITSCAFGNMKGWFAGVLNHFDDIFDLY